MPVLNFANHSSRVSYWGTEVYWRVHDCWSRGKRQGKVGEAMKWRGWTLTRARG